MSDNVTQLRPGGEPELRFSDDENCTSHRAFMGLKGVIGALDALDGTDQVLESYVQLSVAASVLIDILQEREL